MGSALDRKGWWSIIFDNSRRTRKLRTEMRLGDFSAALNSCGQADQSMSTAVKQGFERMHLSGFINMIQVPGPSSEVFAVNIHAKARTEQKELTLTFVTIKHSHCWSPLGLVRPKDRFLTLAAQHLCYYSSAPQA